MGGEVDIEHLSWLARISVSEEEKDTLARRIKAAKRLVDKLLEAPVEQAEPLFHPLDTEGRLRDDTPREVSFELKQALDNASRIERNYVVGPRVVQD